MDRVIDHNFLLQALFGFQNIISFINNHKDKVEQELSKNLIENPNYKYKDIQVQNRVSVRFKTYIKN